MANGQVNVERCSDNPGRSSPQALVEAGCPMGGECRGCKWLLGKYNVACEMGVFVPYPRKDKVIYVPNT